MRFRLWAAALLVVGLATACSSRRAPPPPVVPLARIAPEARVTDYNNGGIREAEEIVVRDSAAWDALWQRVMSTQNDPQPLPPVNFQQEMLVVLTAGRMTANDEVRVDSAGVRTELTADNRRTEYFAVEYAIIRGCGTFQRVAYPLEIVRVRRFPGEVRFVKRTEDRSGSCR